LPYGDLVEGPAVVRRGGWFYIFYSGNFCCARECNYMMGVARSRKLLGPWEKNPANPILQGNETWKCPGHGTVVQDERGRDFLLYHAYKADDFVYVGREAMLDEINWGADGWPTINGGRGPSKTAASPFGAPDLAEEYSFFDDFSSRRLRTGWQWPQGDEPGIRIERRGGGLVVLTPSSAAQSKTEALGAVLARSTTVGNYVVTTRIYTRWMTPAGIAGLSAYGDQENALGASLSGSRIRLWRLEKGKTEELAQANFTRGDSLYVQMKVRDGHLYRFSFSWNQSDWTDLGEELDGSYLPPWDRGVRVALTAGGAPARFDWLRITASR